MRRCVDAGGRSVQAGGRPGDAGARSFETGGRSRFALAPPRAPRSLRGSLIRLPLRSPLLVAVAALLSCSVTSPATEVREALGRAAPLEVRAAGARIALERVAFSDVMVSVDRGRALVVAVVEGAGRVEGGGGEVALAYVGREAFAMDRCPARRWCAADPALPALAAVVEALLGAPRRDGGRPSSWQIRIERDRAIAGEDAELPGGGRAPRRVLELVWEGERWSVASGA